MLRSSLLFAGLLLSAPLGSAQVNVFNGVSPNFGPLLDFDTPAAPLGPIAGNAPTFTAAGITNASIIGAWAVGGDAVSNGTNVSGSGLVFNADVLTVAGVGDPLDNVTAGSGIEFQLAGPVDEFGLNFIDQINFDYEVELFNGTTSLGVGAFTYGGTFPRPGVYWRGPSQFDRIAITWPGLTSGVGFDNIGSGVGPGPAPTPSNCADTGFSGGSTVALTGAVYFDVIVAADSSFDQILTHYTAAAGSAVGVEIYTTPGTSVGNETDPNAWTLVATDNGAAVSAGQTVPTTIDLAAPFTLATGSTGIAILAINSIQSVTITSDPVTSADGNISIIGGVSGNTAFAGGLSAPRQWNGRLCFSGGATLGSNYCTAVANTTGVPGEVFATGSVVASSDDLTLGAMNLPPNQFGIFLASLSQAFVPGTNGTSNGNLCLGGSIGRFNTIINSGTTGEFTLPIGTQAIPQGNGTVAIMAGETWNFQAWHRDQSGLGSNLTDGVSIMFQ